MITENYTMQILKPTDGHLITNLEETFVTDSAFLGINDSAANYKEVTLEEAEIIQERINAAIEANVNQE